MAIKTGYFRVNRLARYWMEEKATDFLSKYRGSKCCLATFGVLPFAAPEHPKIAKQLQHLIVTEQISGIADGRSNRPCWCLKEFY
jgi:hypothetical protein